MALVVSQLTLGNARPADQLAVAKLGSWLESCPDLALLQQLIERRDYLKAKVSCYECGTNGCEQPECENTDDCEHGGERHMFRHYTVGAYADPSQLICKACWKFSSHPTMASPKGFSKKWPATFAESEAQAGEAQAALLTGYLFCRRTQHYLGRVIKCNPVSKIAQEVQFGIEQPYKEHREKMAELQPSWVVHEVQIPGFPSMSHHDYLQTFAFLPPTVSTIHGQEMTVFELAPTVSEAASFSAGSPSTSSSTTSLARSSASSAVSFASGSSSTCTISSAADISDDQPYRKVAAVAFVIRGQ